MAKYELVALPMMLGGQLFFPGYMAHRFGTNISSRHYYSRVGMYHDVSEIKSVAPTFDMSCQGKTPEEYYDE